ncbi:vacuolar amino acid transporter 3 [Venturia nashicola]|uniref:Vacuolar amino acid transporter 3 n=1 Tax=Venturia nashicola TaxID=86259 RepID=A0A4Z1NQ53_9PEZI|nr:vacuolar amino acid transporter 3 [Venturia nashicola]
MADLSNEEERKQAKVVSKHLPNEYHADFDGARSDTGSPSKSAPNLLQDVEGESSLKLQGGDIHRDLFKINARAKLHKRAATFSHIPDDEPRLVEETASGQQQPGGFRRAFVRQKLQRRNTYYGRTTPITRNFVEFLDLYGAFAGEDLEDSDNESVFEEEEEEEEEEEARREAEEPNERRPLLGNRMSSRRDKKGDAGMMQSFFTLLKAFIGTGIMFLPKAFNNGGIVFSSITMLIVATLSMLAFHLLLQCRTQYGGGYGDLGQAIGGPKFRSLILASVGISQIGFVCAGIVFVAENLSSFLEAVLKGSSPLPIKAIIALQLVVLIPLSFIRNISKLGPVALLADVFILIGLTYIYYFDIATLAKEGVSKSVQLFNPQDYTLTIGAAIFTFEGIGLILPIQSSMKKPQAFEWLLATVMIIITLIFTSVGVLCYATFGSDTHIEIISNYPQDSKLVNAVQFLYSIAVLAGTPVQLYPALRIIEGKVFGRRSGKKDVMTKWKKNAFRTAIVLVCGGISIVGSSNLDRFVSLIGSFACVPLVYIYPPLLHYMGVATTKWEKIGDVAMIVLGVVGMIYTTAITLINSFL